MNSPTSDHHHATKLYQTNWTRQGVGGEYPLLPHKYPEKGRGCGRIRENLCAPLFYNSAPTAKTFATAKREISHNCVKSVYILVKVDIEKVFDIAS